MRILLKIIFANIWFSFLLYLNVIFRWRIIVWVQNPLWDIFAFMKFLTVFIAILNDIVIEPKCTFFQNLSFLFIEKAVIARNIWTIKKLFLLFIFSTLRIW